MIARAACAALALVVGALVTRPAAAQPIPEPAAPSPSSITPAPPPPPPPAVTPPPWGPSPWGAPQPLPPWLAPQQAPYGYAPIPIFWRDGAWHRLDEPPPEPGPVEILTTRDPLLPGGLTLAAAGILGTALGIGVLVGAGTSTDVCGLSGCLGLPDSQAQNNGVAVIAGSLGAVVFGGAVALAGARGPHRARLSEGMMMTGMIFTALATSTAIASFAHLASVYPNRVSDPGETLARDYYYGRSQRGMVPLALGVVSLSCMAIGIPLWAVGARARHRRRSASVDPSTLDLLPFPGGASLRWTR